MDRPITIELNGWRNWINNELQEPLPPIDIILARDWLANLINSSEWELRRLDEIRISQYTSKTRYDRPREKRSRDPFALKIPAPFPPPMNMRQPYPVLPYQTRIEWVPMSRKIGGDAKFKAAPRYEAHAVQFPQSSYNAFRAAYVVDKHVAAGLASELEYQGTQFDKFSTFRDVEMITTTRFLTCKTGGEFVVFETAWWLWYFLKATHQLQGRTSTAAHSIFVMDALGAFRASLKPKRSRGRVGGSLPAVRGPDGRWQRIKDKGMHRAVDGKFRKR